MSRPWMPFYVRDYLADTGHLSTLEHGAYLMLIMHYWLHGGLPPDDTKLARIARLTSRDWAEICPTLADFFEPGWRHKRIDAELVTTKEKYQKRAEAGRQGGRVSGRTRQKRTNAEALLQHEASNAEARLNQPQSQSQSQKEESRSATHAQAGTAEEDRFWARVNGLSAKGISGASCKQLVELIGGDFLKANRAIDKVEQAANPGAYLGKVIRNLQQECKAPALPNTNLQVPAFVIAMQAAGIPVEREGKNWRCQGRLRTDDDEEVG